MRQHYLGLDFETYSDVDIGKCGSFQYMDSPVFQPLLLAYAFDDEPVKCLDLTEVGTDIPTDLYDALFDPSIIKCAYNAQFERYVIKKWLGRYSPPEEWLDTMPLAAACGLPLGLAAVGNAMQLTEEQAKLKEGKDLIRYFCIPCRPTKTNGQRTRNLPTHAPEKWELFKSYCIRDVEVERTIRKEVMSLKDIDETERKFWCLDARINEHGVRFDRAMAEHAVEFAERHEAELMEEAVKLTGLENPKSVAQIKTWLKEQEGVEVPSLNKQVVTDVVKGFATDEAKQFMKLRSEFSKTSVSKYKAMLACGSTTDHVRGCFQFNGGHTGRFAGRLLQLQNLPHDKMSDEAGAREILRDGDFETFECLYGDVFTSLSRLIRPTLIPEEGCRFIVADFSAIEARVTAWFAQEQWRLDAFNEGKDIYCASASSMFHVPVVKHGVNGELRAKGKVAELACGYGGGVNALKAFGADKMGLSDEEMVDIVDRWRAESPNICALWRALETAAIKAVTRKSSATSTVGNVRFDYENDILWMGLPSGRRMAFWHPRYEESQMPGRHGKVLSYEYMLQGKRLWTRIETWGGKLTENLVQATARDCLRETMMNLADRGYDIRMHVHDEVICNAPNDSDQSLQEVLEIMSAPIPWAPGLPLVGDGFESPYYTKD